MGELTFAPPGEAEQLLTLVDHFPLTGLRRRRAPGDMRSGAEMTTAIMQVVQRRFPTGLPGLPLGRPITTHIGGDA